MRLRRKKLGPHPVVAALRNPPSPEAALLPTYQPLLDAMNRPTVRALYEPMDAPSPAGYVWVKKLHHT